jgi:CheY-like chemotaxis protein
MKKRPLRILSIDDDPGCQRAAARYLTLAGGHMVEVAFSGKDGLKKAEASKPDAIILDIFMPDMNGIEVLEALHASSTTCGIPVFILTGASLTKAEEAELTEKSNFRLLTQKPASFAELLQRIETAVGLG